MHGKFHLMWRSKKFFLQRVDELQVGERNADTRQPKIRSVRHKELKALQFGNAVDVGLKATTGENVIEQYRILNSFNASYVSETVSFCSSRFIQVMFQFFQDCLTIEFYASESMHFVLLVFGSYVRVCPCQMMQLEIV